MVWMNLGIIGLMTLKLRLRRISVGGFPSSPSNSIHFATKFNSLVFEEILSCEASLTHFTLSLDDSSCL